MIFLGDLACPPEKIADFNNAIAEFDVLSGQVVVLNLEAVIPFGLARKPETLYNDAGVLDGLLEKSGKVIVSLANNHTYDYPEAIIQTKKYLEDKGVGVFGLLNSDGKITPFEYERDGELYAFFGHCWSLYSATNPNKVNNVRMVDCDYGDFLKAVSNYVQTNPERKVYCFMHWNYDLEILPFPMHVKLSRDLIDAGVCGVIGSHSHVTHYVEDYKGRPIAYCLGNFYLPSGIYFDGKLNYPAISKHTIGIKIENGAFEILSIKTDGELPIVPDNLQAVNEIPPPLCSGGIEVYKIFFLKQRRKKFLVPVFDTYTGRSYDFKIKWAIYRVKLIKKIIAWKNIAYKNLGKLLRR